MAKNPKLSIAFQPRLYKKRRVRRKEELIRIVGQFIFTTLALSVIALTAALLHVDSHDFWEVIRAAITLQGILQGTRMLVAVSK